jgi:general secretion pathway protein H
MVVSKANNKNAQGFTLIEIMVVVAIIGTMVALIGVSMTRDTDRLARLESERFHAIVNEVRDESILMGQSFFLEVQAKEGRYAFEGVLGNQQIGYDDGLLKPRQVEQGVELRWEVYAQFDGEGDDEDDDDKTEGPKVLISPLGEITPFVVSFIGDEVTYEVFIDEESQLARRDKKSGFL